jgi:hypothetical protein
MVRLIAIDHIAPPVVIVHSPRLDMQAQQVVEGFGDAYQLSAGLPVGGHRPFIGSRGRSIGLCEVIALQPPHHGQGHFDLA